MIKKVLLCGLGFNLNIILADTATLTELNAFLSDHTENIAVETFKVMEGLKIPTEITLKDEAAKKACISFLAEHANTTPPVTESSPKHTPEQFCECFEKYSKEASSEEREIAGLGVRIVDFDSIVAGLKDEERNEILALKKDNSKLKEALEKWFEQRDIKNTYPLKIKGFDGPEESKWHEGLLCSLEDEHINNFKTSLKTTLEKMMDHEKTRETLILTLVLCKNLKFAINTHRAPWFDYNIVYFQLCDNVAMNVAALYHELNHVLHLQLGIYPGYFSIIGNFATELEQRLFKFLPKCSQEEESVAIPQKMLSFLVHEPDCSFEEGCVENVSKAKLYRIAQLVLLWNSLEEIWNMIGFANIDGCIYINRISDFNLLEIPHWTHVRFCNFLDFSGLPESYTEEDFKDYKSFLEQMEDQVTHDIASLSPDMDVLETWSALQNRKDVVKEIVTEVDKSTDDLLEYAGTVTFYK